MPTVLQVGAFRFHFYSDESNEPPHIHVRSPEGECKFWLETVRLARNRGIRAQNLRRIERLVFENREILMERYDEYHRRER
jgi:hypothetical protein